MAAEAAAQPTLGIDFGTSNSAAAWTDGQGRLRVIALEDTRSEMPTAVFFASDTQQVLFGSAAMQAYLAGTEGRLLRSLKSLLGSPLMDEYTAVNGQMLRFFDILVLFFKELKRRCEAQTGQAVAQVVVGRPVHFVDDNPSRDALAQQTLEQAAQQAGWGQIRFQFEPVAAALDFERHITQETTTLVVDIGGGTSDFTVIRLNPARSHLAERSADVLATTGVHIGGTDFDRQLDLDSVMPLLGYRHRGPLGRPVPSGVYFDLSTWHLIHQSYTRRAMQFAQGLWTDFADLRLHQRLMQALQEQHGHRMLSAVEEAKIACSISAQEAPLALDFLSDLDGVEPVRLTVPGMAQSLHGLLEQVVQCAQRCVAQSGLAGVDAVYLTGGSSALRPLIEALRAAMPQARLVEGNRLGGVAAGLALTLPSRPITQAAA